MMNYAVSGHQRAMMCPLTVESKSLFNHDQKMFMVKQKVII